MKSTVVLSDRVSRFEISSSHRAQAKRGDYSWHLDVYALGCSRGVWDEGHNLDRKDLHRTVVEVDRKDICFYWPHRQGMFFPAAEQLQGIELADRQAARDRRLTMIGLWVAALALVAQVVLGWLDYRRH